jgi:hypothetical protein
VTNFGTSFADEVYDKISPLTDPDAGLGYPLRSFIRALGGMMQQVDWLAQDSPDGPGWSRLVNLSLAPTEALPWLAQFVGVDVDPSLDDASQRYLIARVSKWERGTPASIIAAAQTTLTGTKTVTLVERNGSAYNLTVVTKASETPNPAATLAALLSQKPAGIILSYQNIDGQTYGDLFTLNAASYDIALNKYANYQNLLFNKELTPSFPFGHGTFGAGTFGGGS